jgi:hypothetical protein
MKKKSKILQMPPLIRAEMILPQGTTVNALIKTLKLAKAVQLGGPQPCIVFISLDAESTLILRPNHKIVLAIGSTEARLREIEQREA